MASAAVQNPPTGESKSARKKKAKADAAANGPEQPLADPAQATKEDPTQADGDEAKEHPYISSLAKQVRNLNKKLAALSKSDAIVAENKGVSLDELVAQKKLNADQKASLQKKPQIQQQLAELQEQISQYRKLDADYQSQLSKQKSELEEKHEREVAELKESLATTGVESGAKELKSKLLIFSQFLRCAAAKRVDEANQDSAESKAFEGALLYVYGGDEVAVDTALKIIEGSEEMVAGIDEENLGVKFSQIKKTSTSYAPFQSEESWVDSVAEANATVAEAAATEAVPTGTDPTINHAGLTELSAAGAETNGVTAQDLGPAAPGDVGDGSGNAAGDRWDTTTAGGAEKSMEDSFEMVPRPNEEVDTPAPPAYSAGDAGAVGGGEGATSWADETAAAATGNQASNGWDMKAAGQSAEMATPGTANGWADGAADSVPVTTEDGDGFQAVGGRSRGGRGRGRGGDGELRGRGRGRGGFRGDGEFRGRGRGGFRGGRGDGEFRGRGRGRGGPRGDMTPRT